MSRITHFKIQPKNIQYWDYYILCHLDIYAAIALQRFEYWDGTKNDGNVHAEDINEILESLEEEATQDTSRFFYKAQDELQWELMGLTGETYTANLVNFLIKDLKYLEQRNNPSNAMDRKKQYLFHDDLVQDHVNYLGYIIDYFKRLGFRLNPIYYAIEQLTAAKVYIDTLNIALVTDKLTKMYAQMEEDEAKTKESKKYKPVLPKFIRIQLDKDKDLLPRLEANKMKRFRNFTEWKTQNYGMESVETRDAICKNTDSIPQNYGSNSNNYNSNYNQQLQTARKNAATSTVSSPDAVSSSTPSRIQSSSVSSQEQAMSPQQSAKPVIEQSTTVDNSVDKTTNGDASSLIVNETTSNRQAEAAPAQGESLATRNTSNEANTGINAGTRRDAELSAEEQRIQGYWCQRGYLERPSAKKHWQTLSKHIKSFEDFESLFEHTEKEILDDPNFKNKTVSPGNLANAKYLDGWKQARHRAEAQKSGSTSSSKSASVSGMRNYTFEPEKATEKPANGPRKPLPKFEFKRVNKTTSVVQ